MDNSILNSIKKLLGISKDNTHFDQDIIVHINSMFMVLCQLGVGPEEGFTIQGAEEIWDDFISDKNMYKMVETWMYLRVRLLFDPPSNSVLVDAMKKNIDELEFRLYVEEN